MAAQTEVAPPGAAVEQWLRSGEEPSTATQRDFYTVTVTQRSVFAYLSESNQVGSYTGAWTWG